MNVNSAKTLKAVKDPLSYLMNCFHFSDENYLKHTECLSLACETDNEKLQKSVAVLRFQPTVITDVLFNPTLLI
jgi:hypothetical protein